jgi:hypothetical protein
MVTDSLTTNYINNIPVDQLLEPCTVTPLGFFDSNNPNNTQPGFSIIPNTQLFTAVDWSILRSCNTVIMSLLILGDGNAGLPVPTVPSPNREFSIGTLIQPAGISVVPLGSPFCYYGSGTIRDDNVGIIGTVTLKLDPITNNLTITYNAGSPVPPGPIIGVIFASITFMIADI